MADIETCDRCGDEYDPYPVLIKDDLNSISSWVERKEKYEHLCPDCDEEYWDGTPGFGGETAELM